MEEAIRRNRGEIHLKTTVVEIPDPPPEIPPEELKKLRIGKGMSREVFARVLNVPTRIVQSWEDGTRKPAQAALRLIQVFRQDPSGVLQAAGMAASPTQAVKTNGAPKAGTKRRRPSKTAT
jgi:putative transcriptional regulator